MMLLLAEVVVLAIAAALALRIALKPPLLREFRDNPGFGMKVLALPATASLVLLWAANQWPSARHALAAAAIVAMTAAWWRARTAYGHRRRWPPGSLGVSQSLDAIDDRRFYIEQAERYGPVFKMSQFGRPVICVLGLQRARRLLAEHGASLAGATLPHNRLIPRGFLRYMHTETHKAIAPLFRATFASIALRRLESEVRACYRWAVARLAADSAGTSGGVNARPYLERAVFESLAWLLYGLSPGDPRVERLHALIAVLQPGRPGGFGWRRRTRASLASVTAIMQDVRCGWANDENVPPSALKSLVDSVPEAIADPTYAWNFAMVSGIAYSDLTGLNDWIFKMCCDHPGALETVRAAAPGDVELSAAEPSASHCIVMETLRLEQSEYLYRRVARPFEFEGYRLPKGWLIRLLIQESHRDPAVFADPDRFDPQRFLRRKYARSEYSPFGADAHGCMGFRLAQLLGSILVEELARYDCQVVGDGSLERGNRHRHHWRPSSRLRVVLRPRAAALGTG